jgi:hypothetical protein
MSEGSTYKKTVMVTLNVAIIWRHLFYRVLHIFFILGLCYYFLAMEERAIQRAERRQILAEKKKKQEEDKLVINSECKLRQEKRFVQISKPGTLCVHAF